jgi:predicted transcriptional regulator
MISFIDARHERATVIMAAIRAKPGMTMTEIAEVTEINAPTVCKYLSSLTEKDWVEIETIGVKKFYTISNKGSNALSIFKWLAGPSIAADVARNIIDGVYTDED